MKKKRLKAQQERLVIWAAKGMFKSARKLATALKPETQRKVLIVRSDSLRFKPRDTDTNLNWGNSNRYTFKGTNINSPLAVGIAVHKLDTFKTLQDKCNIPEWTTDREQALKWYFANIPFLLRTTLTGFGGAGIIFHDKQAEDYEKFSGDIKEAPLYVQYKKKKKEFRVHVFKGEVIDITQKKKRKDFDGEINTKIRNYGNGWVYCREGIEPLPEDLTSQAITAVHALGLDFGAVDAIYNEKENKTYILEINSAPGMEGQTIEAYKNAILKQLEIN